ncbi:MAG: MBL fold metallo-hydrolase [Phycisphaerales bacterium]|nr:MBL fold metallo-hydrolase [Phycisphaerales bacterium]
MLTITFLGVGGAFAKRNYQSNALIEAWTQSPNAQVEPDDNLLIDFGSTGPLALHDLKDVDGFEYLNDDGHIRFPSIKRIFISHQHADHIGGLEELAFANRFMYASMNGDTGFRPQLISSADILERLWDHSLKGGLGVLKDKSATLDDYFDVLALAGDGSKSESFDLLKRYRFSIFSTDHLSIRNKYDWPSLGLFVTDTESNESAFYSGDTKYDFSAYETMLRQSKMIFHDVQLQDQPDPVHALLSELWNMPPEIRQKTHLYHYDDSWDDPRFDSVREHFAGFVAPRKRYIIFE